MKKTITIFMLLLLATTLFSYGQKENYLKEENLKGSIKYFEEIRYKSIVLDGKDVEKRINKNNVMKFNEDGKVEFIIDEITGEGFIFKYDSCKNNIETLYSINQNNTGKIVSNYDEKGNLIESILYFNDGIIEQKTIYKYEDNGNMTEEIYDFEGNLNLRTKYTYDINKNIISLITSNSRRTDRINLFSYDLRGNKTEWIISQDEDILKNETFIYDDNDNLIQWNNSESWKENLKYIYTYDNKGNEIEVKSYDKDGKLHEKSICKYEYDKKDNWTKKITYNELSKLTKIEERKIVYYGDKDENDYQVWDDLIKPDL
ncbi:MAG: hypothetical protein WC135_02005 [Bacteroidales bacterium]